LAFNLVTSGTYIINDLVDAQADRLHPTKKFRPIASGELSPKIALAAAVALIIASLYLASFLNQLFLIMTITYLLFQILYSLVLKNLAIIDILIIAAGFIIRILAGAFVIDAHLSVWFLLCIVSTALFLASGKRRAELNLITAPKKTRFNRDELGADISFSFRGNRALKSEENAIKETGLTRKSLTHYKPELLNSYVTMFGNASWMSWSLFTFFESPPISLPVWLFLAELSRATTISKLLMMTIPVVIYGIMRYESLIFEGRAEIPEKLLLTDKSLITSIFLWLGLVVWILYGGVTNLVAP
jgi:hypothetical protein